MKTAISKLVSSPKIIAAVYILAALGTGIQSLVSGTKTYHEGGLVYNRYNNYTIFEKSFHHLSENKDLYILYPHEHWDLYKYTPSFSAFFGLFAVFPDWAGLNLWNVFNAVVLLIAVYYLPQLTRLQKGWVLLIVLIEAITSMQHEQTNPMIAGLLILAFGLLEQNKKFLSALCVLFTAFIKLFGVVGLVMFIFYPGRWKSAAYILLSTALLAAVPLLFISPGQYVILIKSYGSMLSQDHSISFGYSVIGWLHSWFGIEKNKELVVLAGAALFVLPVVKTNSWRVFHFRYLALASVLIWIVIFNHKAESATFVIAMAGIALWFIRSEKNAVNIALFISAMILSELSPTDLFPKAWREEFVKPYSLKVLPCMLIWIRILYDMLTAKEQRGESPVHAGKEA